MKAITHHSNKLPTPADSRETAALWQKQLPKEWRNSIETPLYFKQYKEYEVAAERTLGYDASDQPCFTAHRYQLSQLISDDDEEFYEAISYYEEVAAWRMRDERWLVYRLVSTGSDNPGRAFYSFSPEMPR